VGQDEISGRLKKIALKIGASKVYKKTLRRNL
jgi:hypothetical protein